MFHGKDTETSQNKADHPSPFTPIVPSFVRINYLQILQFQKNWSSRLHNSKQKQHIGFIWFHIGTSLQHPITETHKSVPSVQMQLFRVSQHPQFSHHLWKQSGSHHGANQRTSWLPRRPKKQAGSGLVSVCRLWFSGELGVTGVTFGEGNSPQRFLSKWCMVGDLYKTNQGFVRKKDHAVCTKTMFSLRVQHSWKHLVSRSNVSTVLSKMWCWYISHQSCIFALQEKSSKIKYILLRATIGISWHLHSGGTKQEPPDSLCSTWKKATIITLLSMEETCPNRNAWFGDCYKEQLRHPVNES